jgi:exosortase D (VPLPA-CTERM-specific)
MTSVNAGPMPGLALLAAFALAVVTFLPGLTHIAAQWQREEYSYGYVVWPIALWLAWNRACDLPQARWRSGWLGLPLVCVAIAAGAIGIVSGMPAVAYYAFVLCVYGLVLGIVDRQGFGLLLPSLSFLWFAYPLPSTLYTKVSVFMQQLSSQLGTAVLKALQIPVLLEGNVIDLGIYQLQVAEACNGLRYLFPIICFGYLVAYTYRGPLWQKAVIVAAAAPITILINSVRIAVTGVLVRFAGIEMAEGFLHWFEGFVVALAGLFLLYVVVAVLARLAGFNGSVWANIRFELFWPIRRAPAWFGGRWSLPLVIASALLAAASGAAWLAPERQAELPPRQPFVTFPMQVGEWTGRDHAIEANFLAILKVDDYLMADFVKPRGADPVEIYATYHRAQDNVAGIHSPGVCIPAGGWEITAFKHHVVTGIDGRPQGLAVNRAEIAKGLDRRLVYYWFEQRGRQLTNEYAIKVTNVIDAVTKQRTDGAMIRLTTPIVPLEPAGAAEARLEDFLRQAYPLLRPHLAD